MRGDTVTPDLTLGQNFALTAVFRAQKEIIGHSFRVHPSLSINLRGKCYF